MIQIIIISYYHLIMCAHHWLSLSMIWSVLFIIIIIIIIYFSSHNFQSNLTDSTTFFDLNLQAKKKEFLANKQLSSGEYSTIDLLQKVCTADGDDDDDDGNDDDGDDNDDDWGCIILTGTYYVCLPLNDDIWNDVYSLNLCVIITCMLNWSS